MMGNSALNIELKNKGARGNIYVEPTASSWFTDGWAKAVYLYRNELRIIGRGVLAGANLAVERWEQRQCQQDGDEKGKEVEEEKEQEKEEEKTSVAPTEDKGISQSASAYPHPLPIQPPRGLHESSRARFFDPRSPPYPAPYCRPRDPVHTPAPAPAPTAYIRRILHDREVQENRRKKAVHTLVTGGIDASGNFDRTNFCGSSTDGDDVSVPPNRPYDSSGFDADMNVSEEESVVCNGTRVSGHWPS